MKGRNAGYLPAVDHLRLLAALMVLTFHGFFVLAPAGTPRAHPHHWPGLLVMEGHTGVTLFMVLSGFILTYGALGYPLRYGRFLRNRVLRIAPLLAVFVVIVLTTDPAGSLPASPLGLIVPRDSSRPQGLLVVVWSIAVEVQLYLVFPALLRVLERGGPTKLLSVLLLTAGIRFAALSHGADADSVLYLSVFARADQFVLGMVAAWLLRRFPTRLWAPCIVAGGLIVIPMLAAINAMGGPEHSSFSGLGAHWAVLSPTVEGLGWALVVLGYVGFMRRARGLVTRGLAALGATTYSVYLLHLLVLDTLKHNHVLLDVGSTPAVQGEMTAMLVAIPVTLLAARLSYNLIELPFLRMRTQYVVPPQPPAEAERALVLPVPLAS